MLDFSRTLNTLSRIFRENQSYSQALALSYYTLLSLVPILAVAFGIAKGFGFEQLLETQILETFYQQQYIAQKIISFAHLTLENARGSLIAGVGVILLFWSTMGLFGYLESALNKIWKVYEMRSFIRRITDFLPVLIFGPIFIVATSSFTFLVITKLVEFLHQTNIFPQIKLLIYVVYYVLLLLITWLFYCFIYIYLPNKQVPWVSCILAGLLSAIAFQIVQWGYIHFQVLLTSYNAIYGSFAAIPLFLIWLQISWLITLAGAEIAHFHAQNRLFSIDATQERMTVTKQELFLLALVVCCQRYTNRVPLQGSSSLAQALNVKDAIASALIDQSIKANLIVEMHDREGSVYFFPYGDPSNVFLKEILNSSQGLPDDSYEMGKLPQYEFVKQVIAQWDIEANKLPSNLSLQLIAQSA